MLREAFLASLQPDIVHITSLMEGFEDNAVHSIGLLPFKIPTAVTFYDVIPLIQSEVYLAISESSRLEAVEHLNITVEQAVNIAAAADDIFKPIDVSQADEQAIRTRFGLTRSFIIDIFPK